FIDGGHLAAAGARWFKSRMRDALDLGFAVAHRVQGVAVAGWPFGLAGLAKVDAAQKLAHDQNVSSVDHLRAQRRTIFQSGEANRWAQVGEDSQLPAKTQQAAFRTKMSRKAVE